MVSRGFLLAAGLAGAMGLVAVPVLAAPPTLEVSLSQTDSVVGDFVTLHVSATSNIRGQFELQVPSVAGLEEQSRQPSQSTLMSFGSGGGVVELKKSLTIEYLVTGTGSITIKGIRAVGAGGVTDARPLVLRVRDVERAPASQTQPGTIVAPQRDEGQVFARFRTDKAEVYVGEQLLLDLHLYSNARISIEDFGGLPQLEGFWNEIVDQPRQLQGIVERVGNTRYRSYRLWRAALFPLQAGTPTISGKPLTLVQERGLFATGNKFRRRPPPIGLSVLPLPVEGRPANFSSTNVGEYRLKATVDRRKVDAGKAIVLTVTLSGRGNLLATQLPKLRTIDGFRAIPPTREDKVDKDNRGVSGTRSEKWILMPTRSGRLSIPALELPIFRPSTAAYEVLTTPKISIYADGVVEPNPAPPLATARPDDPTEAAAPRIDLVPMRFGTVWQQADGPPWKTAYFIPALAGPPLLFVLILLGGLLRDRRRQLSPKGLRRQALRKAMSDLEAAESMPARPAWGTIATSVYDTLRAVLDLELRGLALDGAREELELCNVPSTLIEQTVDLLEALDRARFAPGDEQPDAAAMAATGRQLIKEYHAWAS